MREFNDDRKKRILITLFVSTVILSILSIVLTIRFGRMSFDIGQAKLRMSTLIGCAQIFIYMMGISMIFMSPKLGFGLAVGVIGVSFVGSTNSMIMAKQFENLPGTVNSVFFLIASYVVYKFCTSSEERVTTDDITGLSNSYEFEHTLYKKVQANEKGYLLIMHIDGFSQEYASLGREAGDEILRVFSNRIRALIDSKSQAFKLEGAEFAIILSEHENYAGVADRIIRSIEEPVQIEKNESVTVSYLTAHIGISVFLNGGVNSRDIIWQSDIAKNYALKSKLSKISVFTEEMNDQIARVAMIEKKIKESFDKGYFTLDYQPRFSTKDKTLRGFEAILGIDDPQGEVISTAEIIETAEKSDQIFDIDKYVLRRAMREFCKVCTDSGNNIIISVGVSSKEICRAGFANMLFGLIEELHFPPQCLEIEITEYSLAGMKNQTVDNINRLRNHGVLVSLGDFGTGYTSLGQLMVLSVNSVKLDKSLVEKVAVSEKNTDFVRSVVYMGHVMNAEVIAEGVESEKQLEILREFDCEYIQGALCGSAMDYSKAAEMIG